MFFYNMKKWWDTHGWGIIFIGSVVALFLLWLCYSRHEPIGTSSTTWQDAVSAFYRPLMFPSQTRQRYQQPRQDPVTPKISQGEKTCKEFAEFITGKKFIKTRPGFLLNPVTQHPLELDLYNDELRLAIEYNGVQHYKYNTMMHGSREKFHNQQYRDIMKKQLCEDHGVRLICVPYTIPHQNIPQYLYDEMKKLAVI